MCGRYYIDSDMADEIEKVVHDIDQRIRQEHFAGDIFPTNVAPIIEKSEHGLKLDVCKWGYPVSQGKNLVINARTESVMDKPSFRNGILYHRILIPASGFYEWNRLKEKNVFSRYDAPVLYMAGFCDWFENCKFCSNGTPILKSSVHSFWFSGTRFLLKAVRFSFIIVM